MALKTRDLPGPKPRYQLLINPCCEKNFETSSYLEFASGYGLSREGMIWFWDQYLQGKTYNTDPYACPSTAKDFSNLAEAIIVTAESDPLKDDGIQYQHLLQEAGVRTHYKEYPGIIHGFANLGAITPRAHEAISDCGATIKTIIA